MKYILVVLLFLPLSVVGQNNEQLFDQARTKYLAGSYNETIKLVEKVKGQLGATNTKIEGLLTQSYFNNGDFIEAKIAYEKLLKLTSSNVKRSSSFESFLALGGQIDAALEKAEQEHEENVQKERNREAEKIEREWQAKEEAKKRELQSQPKDAAYFYAKAKQTGTKEAYNEIASTFPKSKQAGYAKKEINKIKENERILRERKRERERIEREKERQRKERERERALRANKKVAGPPLIDPRDGQRYETVKFIGFGKQLWMAENLNYKTRGSYKNNVDTKYPKLFGRLYTREAALEACPPGWVLPTAYDYANLATAVNIIFKMDENGNLTRSSDDVYIGNHLKSKNWWGKNYGGFDNFGFKALPGGYALADKGFLKNKANYFTIGYIAIFWTSTLTDYNQNIGLLFQLKGGDASYDLVLKNIDKFLAPIRCMKYQ